ncbi:MAG: hypothetical protein ACOYN7_08875 [Candidatus Nanopelagicales bacterium]
MAPTEQSVLADSKEGSASESSNSYGLPDCTGQDSGSCSYAGFNPAVDGFSFENWGGAGNLGATDLIAMFGRNKVCASGSGNECVLYPAAQQWADQVNESMAGGHCEGMAVTSELIHGGYLAPSDFDPAAKTTFDLKQDNPVVSGTIEYWFATQNVEPVQRAYQAFHKKEPSQIAAELALGLKSGAGYTMGIYAPDGGHALTPIAVTNEGDLIAIHVYDNNYPGTVQRIMIDPRSEQWSYGAGSTNPQAPTNGWEGGIGTIELTPMESRLQTPFPAPFTDKKGGGKTSQIMLTSPDPDARLGVLLTIDGKVYDTRDSSEVLPAGVNIRSTVGSSPVLRGNWMSMTIDRDQVGPFAAEIARQGDETAPIPVTMSIDDPTSPRVTLRAIDDDQGAIVFDVARDGALDMKVAAATSAEVNVANGLNGANFPLPGGVNMRVQPFENGVAEIGFFDEDDRLIGEFPLSDESESGAVTEIQAEFQPGEDGEQGYFEVTEEEVAPEEVDEAELSWLKELNEVAEADETFASGNDYTAGDTGGSDDSAGDNTGGGDDNADDTGGGDDNADDTGGSDDNADDTGGSDDNTGDDAGGSDDNADDTGSSDDTDKVAEEEE